MNLEMQPSSSASVGSLCTTWFYLLLAVTVSSLLKSIPLVHGRTDGLHFSDSFTVKDTHMTGLSYQNAS